MWEQGDQNTNRPDDRTPNEQASGNYISPQRNTNYGQTSANSNASDTRQAASTNYGQQNSGTNYGQQTGNTNYSQQNSGTNYAQQTGNTNYGQQNSGTSYGQQTGNTNYSQQNSGTSYGQQTGNTNYGQQNSGTNYGQQTGNSNYERQNAWENPYASRYNQTQGQSHYQNAGYSYNGGSYNGYPSNPAGGRKKKKGAGKIVAIALAVAAALGLLTFGLYEVAQHIPLNSDKSGQAVAGSLDERQEEAIDHPQKTAPDKDQSDKAAAETPDRTDGKGDSKDSQRVTTLTASSPIVVTDVTEVVAASMPAIVSIDNNFTETINYFGQRYTQEATGSGSGIIVGQSDDALLIATNYHVVENADSLNVQFVDGKKADAIVKDTDPDMDLAVIAVPLTEIEGSTMDSIVIATLGDSDSLVLGEPAIAIGNALGQGQSVTVGVVSAIGREVRFSDTSIGTFIQTDAAINPGNSGGALLNSSGEVIGINSSKFADTDVEGMGFAIPISQAQPIIDEMMNRELVSDEDRGYLGISGSTVPYEYTGIEGVRIRAVAKGSGAESAGLQADDIVTKLNGEAIKSMESLQNKLKYFHKNDTVTLTILRRQDDRYVEVDVSVKLTDGDTAGITSSDDTEDSRKDRQSNDRQGAPNEEEQGNDQPGDDQNGQDGNFYYYFGNGDDGNNSYGFPFSFPFFGNGSY